MLHMVPTSPHAIEELLCSLVKVNKRTPSLLLHIEVGWCPRCSFVHLKICVQQKIYYRLVIQREVERNQDENDGDGDSSDGASLQPVFGVICTYMYVCIYIYGGISFVK